jgi:hypothetical protein
VRRSVRVPKRLLSPEYEAWNHRYSTTMNLLQGIRLLAQPITTEHIGHTLTLIDKEIARAHLDQISPGRLRGVAAFCSALASAMEPA